MFMAGSKTIWYKPGMSEISKLIVAALNAKGITQADLAQKMNVTQQAVSEWVGGSIQAPRKWKEIAVALGIPLDEAQRAVNTPLEQSTPGTLEQTHLKVATFRPSNVGRRAGLSPPAAGMIPILGRAAAGEPGKIVLLGEVNEWIPCPPELIGVEGGYATYVHGSSMEPRYFHNERVYVHPTRPVGKDDFVVAQVSDEEQNRSGYVKQLVTWNRNGLTLHQYNPDTTLAFDADRVDAVHLIVGSGRG